MSNVVALYMLFLVLERDLVKSRDQEKENVTMMGGSFYVVK